MDKVIQIVSVVNDFRIYDETVRKNPFMNRYPLHCYDNRTENRGIPARFNDFIRNHMEGDAWVVFCHQDFGFLEDPMPTLRSLSTEFIYGPIGARRMYGIFLRNLMVSFSRKILLGQIRQACDGGDFRKIGTYLHRPTVVETVDCCCLIVHGSLIKRHHLTFDENLDFHLYSEDFSLSARYRRDIRTKAAQFECAHHRPCYEVAHDFGESLKYLRSKHSGKSFVGTCND